MGIMFGMRDAAEVRELHAVIERIKHRWFRGEIGVHEKRQLIAREVEFFHGAEPARRVTLTLPRDTEEELYWWQEKD